MPIEVRMKTVIQSKIVSTSGGLLWLGDFGCFFVTLYELCGPFQNNKPSFFDKMDINCAMIPDQISIPFFSPQNLYGYDTKIGGSV